MTAAVLVPHLLTALILPASGLLVGCAWRRGLGEAGTFLAVLGIVGAVVLLIAAGEAGWPLSLRLAAALTLASGFAALWLGPPRRTAWERWERFERDFGAYAAADARAPRRSHEDHSGPTAPGGC